MTPRLQMPQKGTASATRWGWVTFNSLLSDHHTMSFDHTAIAGMQLLASLPPCETNRLLSSTLCLLVQHVEGE